VPGRDAFAGGEGGNRGGAAGVARALPDEGHCCYHYALAAAVSRLPFPAEQLRPKFSPLWRYLETMDEDAARDRAEEAAAR
jgi:hypothetical protein